jgi:hypothetical protein
MKSLPFLRRRTRNRASRCPCLTKEQSGSKHIGEVLMPEEKWRRHARAKRRRRRSEESRLAS